jgi:positive phototaxis protein PixI
MVEPFTKVSPEALAIAPKSDFAATEEQFLRLLLIPDTAIAVSVTYLMEILTVSVEKIVPIPHLPPWVMGVYNWRGEILWMVDLGHLFGLTPWYQQPLNRSEFSAVVLRQRNSGADEVDRGLILGLLVHEVDDIEWLNSAEIKPLPASVIAPGIAPFVQGCWWNANGNMLMVVDGAAILRAMPTATGNQPAAAPPERDFGAPSTPDFTRRSAIESHYYPDLYPDTRRAT